MPNPNMMNQSMNMNPQMGMNQMNQMMPPLPMPMGMGMGMGMNPQMQCNMMPNMPGISMPQGNMFMQMQQQPPQGPPKVPNLGPTEPPQKTPLAAVPSQPIENANRSVSHPMQRIDQSNTRQTLQNVTPEMVRRNMARKMGGAGGMWGSEPATLAQQTGETGPFLCFMILVILPLFCSTTR